MLIGGGGGIIGASGVISEPSLKIDLTQAETATVSHIGAAYLMVASLVDVTSAFTLKEIRFYLSKTGSPSVNMTARIRAHGSSAPGTLLGTSNAVSSTTVTSSITSIAFTGLNQALSGSTKYWIELALASAVDYSNYITASCNGSTTYPGYNTIFHSNDGISYTGYANVNKRAELWGV